MKKILIIVAIVLVVAVAGVCVFLGCGKKGGIDMKFDFSHMNDKVYNAHINISSNDEVTEFDEEEPDFARIENEKENYVLDLDLTTEAKDAYEQFNESAKEEEVYKEVKFGSYNGYYATSDDDEIYGYILLDDSDETFNAYMGFDLYLFDDEAENVDIQAIYDSPAIQNILNNITFKVSK